MSGNPFRTSAAPNHTTTAPPPISSSSIRDGDRGSWARVERDSDAGLDAAPAALPPAKTKKSVRIESPTEAIPPHPAFHSVDNSFTERVSTAQHASVPTFTSSAGIPNSADDSSATSDIGRREDFDIRGYMSPGRRVTDAPEVTRSPGGVPANPFSKTLATLEPQERGSGEPAGQSRDRTGADRSTPTSTKPSLDVESFKNMLMTGISSPRSSGPPPLSHAAPTPSSQHQNPPAFESSSSTDMSSVSRQSLFEPVQEPLPETPRTSYEMAPSDDERVSLMGELRTEKQRKEKKRPPPAPRHRHGKLVTSRTPQTVSFDDFKIMEPTTSPPITSRDTTDLNKPLPPTPPVLSSSQTPHIVSQDSSQDLLPASDSKANDITTQVDATPPSSKKVPPPVPLTRRHSQLRTSAISGTRSRSNSSLTISSQHSTDLPTPSSSTYDLTPSPSSSQKIPPPPPPSRHRGAALSTISTSSANSSSTELYTPAASATTPRRPTLSSPNPPPARRTTLSSDPPSPAGASLARSPSTTSSRTANRAVSNESTTSLSMPPPPPPPRKRTSASRSSLDKERSVLPAIASPTSPGENGRTSAEWKRSSIEARRRTSVASESSLKYEYVAAAGEAGETAAYSPREENGGGDMGKVEERQRGDGDEPESRSGVRASTILDDMEKFQREIEELRERYRHAA